MGLRAKALRVNKAPSRATRSSGRASKLPARQVLGTPGSDDHCASACGPRNHCDLNSLIILLFRINLLL